MWVYGLDWTGLAQDRDRWRTLVSAVMNMANVKKKKLDGCLTVHLPREIK